MGIPPTPDLHLITIEEPQAASILKVKTKQISFPLSVENKALIEAMKEKLYELAGVGLAAPQVREHKRIIAVHISKEAAAVRNEAQPYPMHILINPSYEPYEKTKTISDFEACFSVSSKAGKVPRFHTILLKYQDESGMAHKEIATGFYARVLQHEIDHLDGTLITDRLTANCVQGTLPEMMALRRNELSPEKRTLYDEIVERQKQLKQT